MKQCGITSTSGDDQFDGGGEKKGIVGIVVGMFGNGGSVTFGAVGKLGSVGFGKDGNVGFGNGGSVALGKVVGREGNGVEGNGGNVSFGRVGNEGNGGIVGFGRENAGGGAAGVSRRWRAARLISKLEKHNATRNDNRKQCLKGGAMVNFLS
ncbi:hypothetical protein JRO89_XS08G0243700 [Xanthoceras sorbifolium]|uniref:Uncharacterized protein n=1 Tax=Xanthoceras sorbifolium TaxID=99658 RepID=A0ABQ8HR52_9ROSI|nr:hypothetical protein JRO89_XS08G0243700 [Xanthoceras sorbifolium]